MFFFYQYDKYMLSQRSLRNVSSGGRAHGYALNIRLNTYRGLPLSCIESLLLKVDGEDVPAERVAFCINGKRFMPAQLPELYAEWWDVLDEAELHVDQAGGLAPGTHTVEIEMRRRGPYMYNGSTYFRFTGHDLKTFELTA